MEEHKCRLLTSDHRYELAQLKRRTLSWSPLGGVICGLPVVYRRKSTIRYEALFHAETRGQAEPNLLEARRPARTFRIPGRALPSDRAFFCTEAIFRLRAAAACIAVAPLVINESSRSSSAVVHFRVRGRFDINQAFSAHLLANQSSSSQDAAQRWSGWKKHFGHS